MATYYDVHGVASAAWSYQDAGPEARLISGMISFDPEKVEVRLDDRKLLFDGPFRTGKSSASRARER